jgi:hypothetical protein
MGREYLYDLIQSQVFVFPDDIMRGNRIFQVYAVTPRVLAKSVDVGGNIRLINRAQLDGLEVLHLIAQRQRIFTVAMHQFQQQEFKRNILIYGPDIHTVMKIYIFLTTTGRRELSSNRR